MIPAHSLCLSQACSLRESLATTGRNHLTINCFLCVPLAAAFIVTCNALSLLAKQSTRLPKKIKEVHNELVEVLN